MSDRAIYAELDGTGNGIRMFIPDKEGKKYPLKHTLKPHILEGGKVSFSLNKRNRKLGSYSAYLFTKETLPLSQNAEMLNVAKNFMEDNGEEECVVLTNDITRKYIATYVPKKVIFNGSVPDKKVVNKKDDLKAYETPEIFLEAFVEVVSKEMFDSIKRDLFAAILKKIKVKDLEAEDLETSKSKNSREILLQTTSILISFFENAQSGGIDEIVKNNPELAEDLKKIINSKEYKTLKEIAEKYKVSIYAPMVNFFDPQSGSGRGILSAMDKFGIEGKLIGLEIRDIENSDDRYKVVTGADFNIFSDVIENTLGSKKLERNVRSTIFWLNPPYTSGDEVARESVEVLPEGVLTAGLFPTKMLGFLKRNFAGVIFDIPRHITGYTEKETPERFLFLVGYKKFFDENRGIGIIYSNREADVVKVNSIDMEDFKKKLPVILKDRKIAIGPFVRSAMKYFNTENSRLEMLYLALDNSIQAKRKLLEAEDKIKENIGEVLDDIMSAMLPTNLAKTSAVFPDLRFFNAGGEYPKYDFRSVAQNVSLLSFYKKNAPALFDLIKEIAKDENIDLPVGQEEENYIFDIANPKKPEKKDYVTSKELGMMRLYYYPSAFELKTKEQKEKFLKLVENILYRKMEENNEDILEKEEEYGEEEELMPATIEKMLLEIATVLDFSHKAIVKTDKVFSSADNAIANDDVLVLVDEYGFDIGKINIPLSDFYKQLEIEGLFNIDDFVEIPEVPMEKKEAITDNFVEYFEFVLKDIYEFAKNRGRVEKSFEKFQKDLLEEAVEKILDLKRGKINKDEYLKEIVAWAKDNMFDEYFKSKFIIPNIDNGLKKSVGNLSFVPKEEREKIYEDLKKNADKSIVKFYEDGRNKLVEELREKYKEELRSSEANEEAFEEFVQDIGNELSKKYKIIKSIIRSYSKLAEFYFNEYAIISTLLNKGVKKEDIFDKIIVPMFTKRFKLKPHQIEEAVNYLAMEDNKKLEMLFWEMRSGKTRAMIAIGFLLSLLKKERFSLVLETANMPDIAEQMFDSFPFLMTNANFFVTDENKLDFLKKDNIYENFTTTKVFPNIVKILQPYLIGKGEKANELKLTMLNEYEEIIEFLNKETTDLDKIVQQYENSVFSKLLTLCERTGN